MTGAPAPCDEHSLHRRPPHTRASDRAGTHTCTCMPLYTRTHAHMVVCAHTHTHKTHTPHAHTDDQTNCYTDIQAHAHSHTRSSISKERQIYARTQARRSIWSARETDTNMGRRRKRGGTHMGAARWTKGGHRPHRTDRQGETDTGRPQGGHKSDTAQ